ncbi:response regulator [Methyloversatilis universalis]|uniref:response regulator n=1 Tax=Methyloversatilis universalis TaxID=378211 RepID=UPI0003722AD8|nr:response regulator [Methyloversatilis universalis]
MSASLRTVMLIDDSDADNFFHGLLIEQAGIAGDVMVFEWAEKALKWLTENAGHAVDLILLDINMPRMNGFEFLEAFHALPDMQQGDTRICMLSSSALDSERERALAFPRVSGFLTKPLDDDALGQLGSLRTMSR